MQSNKFYFSAGPYQQTLQGLHDALSLPEAFVKLMGPAQSGKTSLCEKLTLYMRRKEYKVVHFDYAIESPDMLRTMLARELNLPNLTNFARVLEDALLEDDKPLVLIFDDAHLLTDITLIEVYRLAEVKVGTKRMLNIVLCGEPSLDQRLLNNAELKSFLLHISHKFYLDAMDPDTLNMFFLSYLEKAGMMGLQLEPAAMNYFYKICKGYPEPAVSLCRLIVESRIGDTELRPLAKKELVQLVKSAPADQNLPSSGFLDNNQRNIGAPILAVAGIASIGFLYQQVTTESAVDDTTAVAIQQADEMQEVFNSENQVESETLDGNSEQFAANTPILNQDRAAAAEIPEEIANVDSALVSEPVSDSTLSLVTAAERGVAAEDIVEPEYEALATLNENIDAAVQLTPVQERRVLTIEDNEAEEDAISLAPNSSSEIENLPGEIMESETLLVDSSAENETLEQESAVDENPIIDQSSIETDATQIVQTESLTESTNDEEATDIPDELESLVDDSEVDSTAIASVENTQSTSISADQELGLSAVDELTNASADSALAESTEGDRDYSVVQAIEADVSQWVSTWQSQSLPEYFSHYHENFVPRYQDTVSAWQANRRRVIGNATWIRLEMSDFQLIAEEEGVYEVHFWLAYESPTYSDNTLKKLLVAQVDDSWQILEEINLQVES